MIRQALDFAWRKALMVSQAFFYNAVFFTYALTLTTFYGIAAERVGYYLVPFAIGNFLGPLLIGRLFDEWGRRPMIAGTYAASAVLGRRPRFRRHRRERSRSRAARAETPRSR